MNIAIQSLINGFLAGGVYSLVAVGVTLLYGVMKMVNFAMGEYLMLGMYMTYTFYVITQLQNYYLIPLVIIAMGLIGFFTFNLVIRPVLGRSKDSSVYILVTVGLAMLLQSSALMVFGPDYKVVPSLIKGDSIQLGAYVVSMPRLLAVVFALIFVIILNLILNRTLLGKAMKATAENTSVSQMLGINTKKTFTIAYIIAIVFAGLAGLLVTPIYYINSTAGSIFKVTSLIIVILGGLGSIPGAFIGGFIVGIVEALVASLMNPDLGPAGIFILLLVILYFKPYGIFGKGARIA